MYHPQNDTHSFHPQFIGQNVIWPQTTNKKLGLTMLSGTQEVEISHSTEETPNCFSLPLRKAQRNLENAQLYSKGVKIRAQICVIPKPVLIVTKIGYLAAQTRLRLVYTVMKRLYSETCGLTWQWRDSLTCEAKYSFTSAVWLSSSFLLVHPGNVTLQLATLLPSSPVNFPLSTFPPPSVRFMCVSYSLRQAHRNPGWQTSSTNPDHSDLQIGYHN